MLLLVDNYDSFTYNLVQSFQMLGADVIVRRNTLSTESILDSIHTLVISPGPGKPEQAGNSKEIIRSFAGKKPILGVCLGHQCIAEVYGGRILKAKKPMHGKTSEIFHDNQGVFKHIPQGFLVTRYHSLIVDRSSLPDCLEVSAETSEGEIMGLRHKELPIEGVQFHPESVMTSHGLKLLGNFLKCGI